MFFKMESNADVFNMYFLPEISYIYTFSHILLNFYNLQVKIIF